MVNERFKRNYGIRRGVIYKVKHWIQKRSQRNTAKKLKESKREMNVRRCSTQVVYGGRYSLSELGKTHLWLH